MYSGKFFPERFAVKELHFLKQRTTLTNEKIFELAYDFAKENLFNFYNLRVEADWPLLKVVNLLDEQLRKRNDVFFLHDEEHLYVGREMKRAGDFHPVNLINIMNTNKRSKLQDEMYRYVYSLLKEIGILGPEHGFYSYGAELVFDNWDDSDYEEKGWDYVGTSEHYSEMVAFYNNLEFEFPNEKRFKYLRSKLKDHRLLLDAYWNLLNMTPIYLGDILLSEIFSENERCVSIDQQFNFVFGDDNHPIDSEMRSAYQVEYENSYFEPFVVFANLSLGETMSNLNERQDAYLNLIEILCEI